MLHYGVFVLRGSLLYDSGIDPAALQRRLAAALERVRARDIRQTPGSIAFRGGIFRMVMRGNVLNSFGSGVLTIDAAHREVRYELDVGQLAAGVLVAFAILAVFAAPPWTYLLAPAGILVAIPIDLARFRSFLRNAIDRVQ